MVNRKSINGLKQKVKEMDRRITFKYLIEKIWDIQKGETFYCFLDLKKIFDIVPHKKLWDRMEELEATKELKTVVCRYISRLKLKLEQQKGYPKILNIDKLEEWINKTNSEGV